MVDRQGLWNRFDSVEDSQLRRWREEHRSLLSKAMHSVHAFFNPQLWYKNAQRKRRDEAEERVENWISNQYSGLKCKSAPLACYTAGLPRFSTTVSPHNELQHSETGSDAPSIPPLFRDRCDAIPSLLRCTGRPTDV